ncbi:hypothetical protein [Desulfovibrio oxyclinae]|nr:hypothetical protein [Desulfovibrio oxyclinae]
MYQFVIIKGDSETIVSTGDNYLEMELQLERHVRSLNPGFGEIRKIADFK